MTSNTPTTQHAFDVLIVGSGLAGLSAALHLAPTHRVAVLTKRGMSDGSSAWAQGTTFGRRVPSSPFSSRQSRFWVRSPPMPQYNGS